MTRLIANAQSFLDRSSSSQLRHSSSRPSLPRREDCSAPQWPSSALIMASSRLALTLEFMQIFAGKFHCDEVFACWMLKKLPEYKHHAILRYVWGLKLTEFSQKLWIFLENFEILPKFDKVLFTLLTLMSLAPATRRYSTRASWWWTSEASTTTTRSATTTTSGRFRGEENLPLKTPRNHKILHEFAENLGKFPKRNRKTKK